MYTIIVSYLPTFGSSIISLMPIVCQEPLETYVVWLECGVGMPGRFAVLAGITALDIQSFTTTWDTTATWDKLNFHTDFDSDCPKIDLIGIYYISATFYVYV